MADNQKTIYSVPSGTASGGWMAQSGSGVGFGGYHALISSM